MSGLSAHVIRIWERRHNLMAPARGANGFRQYSSEDVAFLAFVKEQLAFGYSIGDLAALGKDTLLRRMEAAAKISVPKLPYEPVLDGLLESIMPLNRATFEQRLNDLIAVIPFMEAIQRVLLPLEVRCGDLWHEGKIDVSVEHYVTHQVQQKIASAMNQIRVPENGKTIVVCCPVGQICEVGAHVAAYLCALRGANVYYLGADTPTAALQDMCKKVSPALTLLGITYVTSKPAAMKLIKDLAIRVLPLSPIIAGGAGARAIQSSLKQANIEYMDSLDALDARLSLLTMRRDAKQDLITQLPTQIRGRGAKQQSRATN